MSRDIKHDKKWIHQPLNELSADKKGDIYKTVIENSNDGIIIVQEDKNLFCNQKYLEMSGYEKTDGAAYTSFCASVHPDDRNMVMENMLGHHTGKQTPSRYEFRIIGEKGSMVHAEASSTVIMYEGKPASLSFIRDITTRKQIEETLHERAERFQLLADAAFEGIVIHDRGEILDCNQAMFEMFGYKPKEVIGKSVMRFILPESRELIMRHIEAGSDDPYEIKMAKQDGATLTMEVIEEAIPFKGRTAKVAALHDITDRKLAEKSLRESEQRLADIIQFLPDATFVIDQEGKVIAWNRAIEEMTGVKSADMLGKGDYEYAIPFYGVRRPILVDLLFLSDPEIEARYDFVDKKGNTYFVETFIQAMYGGKGAYLWATASKLFNKDGNIAGAIESIRDITERKQTEKALKESEDKYRSIFENAIEGI
ncbi:MAG: hypothetical protein C0392_07170, partial [Syntrophus sp. (in: bacteria)]|nr:hypothetical protein [Syntrophus sp. (in: bacteria)]